MFGVHALLVLNGQQVLEQTMYPPYDKTKIIASGVRKNLRKGNLKFIIWRRKYFISTLEWQKVRKVRIVAFC